MNTLLKKMMVALLAVGIGQAAWADSVPDFKETFQAAEQGFAAAQYNLGLMYANGHGVHQDFDLSKEWFGKACDGGFQVGCDLYRYLNQKGY